MSDLKPGVYALFDTTQGEITCELYADKAPKTVANFRGLAEGSKDFVDPNTRQATKRRYYDGLATFRRKITGFDPVILGCERN
jgi:peptidyl-prolyl cis-trans isomerase A (cyclophilin A)